MAVHPAQALDVVPNICAALQFAAAEGIRHRDIKPENILLDTKGRVKIADFGIAKLVKPMPRWETGLVCWVRTDGLRYSEPGRRWRYLRWRWWAWVCPSSS